MLAWMGWFALTVLGLRPGQDEGSSGVQRLLPGRNVVNTIVTVSVLHDRKAQI